MEKGLDHFQRKVETTDPETYGTGAAEVLVNLLLKLDRGREAVAVAQNTSPTPRAGNFPVRA